MSLDELGILYNIIDIHGMSRKHKKIYKMKCDFASEEIDYFLKNELPWFHRPNIGLKSHANFFNLHN